VLAPLVLLLAVPNAGINVISGHPYTYQIKYQYSALVCAGIFLATVEACAQFRSRPRFMRFLVVLVAASALVGNVALSPSPLGTKFHTGIWAVATPRNRVQDQAVHLVPADASVSATYALDPHLTHRTHVYEWPNPFRVSYWGVHGENTADPHSVEWLVLDRQSVGDEDKGLLDQLLASDFHLVFEEQDIVVARRN